MHPQSDAAATQAIIKVLRRLAARGREIRQAREAQNKQAGNQNGDARQQSRGRGAIGRASCETIETGAGCVCVSLHHNSTTARGCQEFSEVSAS